MQELFKTNLIICSVYLNKKRRLLEKQTAFKTKFKNSFYILSICLYRELNHESKQLFTYQQLSPNYHVKSPYD